MGINGLTSCTQSILLARLGTMLFQGATLHVSELWNLDALGIKYPNETKSLKKREKEIHEAFLKTIQLNEDGRYEVQLSWLQNPAINDNREFASKKVIAITKKLRADGLFNEYDVFDEWKTEGIEEISIGEVDKRSGLGPLSSSSTYD